MKTVIDTIHSTLYLFQPYQYNLFMSNLSREDAMHLLAPERRLSKLEHNLSVMSPKLQSLADQLPPLGLQTNAHMSHLDSQSPIAVSPTCRSTFWSFSASIRDQSPRYDLRYSGSPLPRFDTRCLNYNWFLFSLEHSKIAFMITNLTSRSRKLLTAKWERHSPVCAAVDSFFAARM